MGTTDNYISVMMDGLKKKILVLEQIVLHTDKEKDLLLSIEFNMDDFDSNMKEKSELIDRLTLLDDGFTSIYGRVKSELESNKPNYVEEIRQMKLLISKITELSVKVQSEESRNKELAQKQFGKMKKEVRTARHSERMAANYYKSMSMVDTEPQFLDKKK